jgi:hypothetical protein
MPAASRVKGVVQQKNSKKNQNFGLITNKRRQTKRAIPTNKTTKKKNAKNTYPTGTTSM